MKRRILSFALTIVMVIMLFPAIELQASTSSIQADTNVNVTFNGRNVQFAHQGAILHNGHVFVPAGIFSVMGYVVEQSLYGTHFDYNISRSNTAAFFSTEFLVFHASQSGNFQEVTLPFRPIRRGGVTLLPIRAPMELLGYTVTWNSQTNTIAISSLAPTANLPAAPGGQAAAQGNQLSGSWRMTLGTNGMLLLTARATSEAGLAWGMEQAALRAANLLPWNNLSTDEINRRADAVSASTFNSALQRYLRIFPVTAEFASGGRFIGRYSATEITAATVLDLIFPTESTWQSTGQGRVRIGNRNFTYSVSGNTLTLTYGRVSVRYTR